jgi:hypothetical protein
MTNNLAFRFYIITLKVNILEKGENVDSYFKAVGYCGDNFDSMLLNYKVRVFANKKRI